MKLLASCLLSGWLWSQVKVENKPWKVEVPNLIRTLSRFRQLCFRTVAHFLNPKPLIALKTFYSGFEKFLFASLPTQAVFCWNKFWFHSNCIYEQSHKSFGNPGLSIFHLFVRAQAGARKIEVELTTVSSNHHVELNPSDAGFQDRYVVQEIIKEMAKNRPLDVAGNRGFKGTMSSSFMALLLHLFSYE